MNESTRTVTWKAAEHNHVEKGADWFWVLGILALAGAIAAFVLGNFLFAIVILVGAGSMAIVTLRRPRTISFTVNMRGVQIDETFHPYSTLESFYIDDVNYTKPQLLLKSKKIYAPLIIIPVPTAHVADVDAILGERLPEEELEEPFINVLLEFFGF